MESCIICLSRFVPVWTLRHGIAICPECGTPYRLLHYDGEDKPLDKPPECLLPKAIIKIINDLRTNQKETT